MHHSKYNILSKTYNKQYKIGNVKQTTTCDKQQAKYNIQRTSHNIQHMTTHNRQNTTYDIRANIHNIIIIL